MLINIFRIDQNAGDYWSSPFKYFSFPVPSKQIDVKYALKNPEELQGNILVFGGGGMVKEDWSELLDQFTENNQCIAWGIGHNFHNGETKIDYKNYLSNFELIGVRDFGFYQHVPCASCMSDVFDEKYEITNDIVVYEHHEHPIEMNYPKMTNIGIDLVEKIRFLGSGKTIITNSYHGSYWGMLLNKKVEIIMPFSSKFYGFKNDINLEECRELNIKFHKKVISLVQSLEML